MSQPGYGMRADLREMPPDDLAPEIEWDDFLTYVFLWSQGQHVGMIGPTESGKSTLTYGILPIRQYVTMFATKPRDRVLDKFAELGGFVKLPDWPPKTRGPMKREITAQEMPRRILWPYAGELDSVAHQREVFKRAIADIYARGGWCVVWDEFWMQTQILKMEEESRILLQQARSNDISFVMGAQRPSRIPLELYDQSTHLFFWRDNDEVNLKRLGGVGWLAAGPIRAFIANLKEHQALYINCRKGWMYRVTAPEL